MAKPRKQRNGEQQSQHPTTPGPQNKQDESLIGGTVLHQKLCLSIDTKKKRIFGHTEMKILPPESGIIGLHAGNMTIQSILINGEPTEFEIYDHYQHVDDGKWVSVSCPSSAADAACTTYISSLDRESVPNLLISCSKEEKPMVDLECQLNCESTSQKSPDDLKNHPNKNYENGAEPSKVVYINYSLDGAGISVHFGDDLLCIDNQIGRAHCWFPCMNSISQRCCYDLEFTVDKNFVAASSGSLLYQIFTDDDPPRKTFVYKLGVPVAASWISLAVAPFEIFPDPHNGLLSHMCMPENLSLLQNTVGFFYSAFRYYEDYLSSPFPFGSYKQVFVPPEHLSSSVVVGASLCICNSELLFDDKVINETINTRIKLSYALARQWFGGYIVAETTTDQWLLDGLAGFLTDLFIKHFLGNNEARYRRYKENRAVCQADVTGATALSSPATSTELYGTQSIGLYGKIQSWKSIAVLQMLEKQMGPESFSKILQDIVHRAKDRVFARTLSTREFRHLANKIGNLERPFLKEFFPRWVGSYGSPVLRLGLSYIKRKNMMELAVMRTSTAISGAAPVNSENEDREGDASWPGMMSVRVHELDGTYDHPNLSMSGESLQLLEIQLHSKLASKRFQKPKKGSKPDGSDDNNDAISALDTRTCMDSPLLWVRVDPEMEYLADVHFHQPVPMWINQLEKDKDVVAQSEAIMALRSLPQLSFSTICALSNFLHDSKAFWRVRIEAAFALAHTSSEEADCGAGLLHLIKFYKCRRYDTDIGLPKPNNFHDIPEYFVLEAIPLAVALVRSRDKTSPREAVDFILQLLKYNDNNGNPYSDIYWLATLVQSIGELELGKQHIPFMSSLFKRMDRLLQFERSMTSYNGILTIACIDTLTQIALKTPVAVPLVYDRIKSFRTFGKWKVRLEANKSLLSLEFYNKGLDASLSMFLDYLEEESCFRGQSKLAAHMMHLCEEKNMLDFMNCAKISTLVALLRFLAGTKAFNNIFLRHYLFCILQVVAGRPPTLYGVPRVPFQPMVDREAFKELKIKSPLLRSKISRAEELETVAVTEIVSSVVLPGVDYPKDLLPTNGTAKDVPSAAATEDVLPLEVPSSAANEDVPPQDIPPDAAAKDVPPPADVANVLSPTVRVSGDVVRTIDIAKDAETISNSCERRVVKIRLKKPTLSFKTDGNDNLLETSRGWRDEADVGHSSSVSVDAPPRQITKETLSITNQVLEEVNYLHGHESHTTASVGSAMMVNNDDVGNELQCTADSRKNGVEDRSLPTFTRTGGVDDTQKSSCLPVLSLQGHDEDDPLISKEDRDTRGKKSKDKKDKKHKDKKRKRDDKSENKDRHHDSGYSERKRLKKEKKRIEKELAKAQQKEATTTSRELPTSSKEISPLMTLMKAEGTSQVAAPTVQENRLLHVTSTPSTKVRIKIKSRIIPNP